MGDLRIKDLVVEYSIGGEAFRVIDGLSLEVTAGSLVIVLGPSGCGKTTLLSCIGGILSPTSGSIQVGDIDVTTLDRRGLTAYRRRDVGIVFQSFNLVPSGPEIRDYLARWQARPSFAKVKAKDAELAGQQQAAPA